MLLSVCLAVTTLLTLSSALSISTKPSSIKSNSDSALVPLQRLRKRDSKCLSSLNKSLSIQVDSQGNQIKSNNDEESCPFTGLSVSLKKGEGLQACRNCFEAHSNNGNQGVILIDSWEGAFCPSNFHIDGEAVFPIPNDLSSNVILNPIDGAIAVCLRGTTSFSEKAKTAQSYGAIALIIIDYLGPQREVSSTLTRTTWCSEKFECGSWLGSRDYNDNELDGSKNSHRQHDINQKFYKYMGEADDSKLWKDISIPVVFLTNRQGERLVSLMNVEKIHIDGISTGQLYVPE